MEVMKFGGTSLENSDCILHAAKIVAFHTKTSSIIVVASAMAGVTDTLISLTAAHEMGDLRKRDELCRQIAELHEETCANLKLGSALYSETKQALAELLIGLNTAISSWGSKLLPHQQDFAISYGERLSSLLLSAGLRKIGIPSRHVFGSDVLEATEDYGNANARIDGSTKRAERVLLPLLKRGITPVVTGFFGGTASGTIATFGRGGSDYSAAVLAAVLRASKLTVWKEVDGVYTADPKQDAGAKLLPRLSYDTAAAMARSGAKVLHPECMEPVRQRGIPVHVRNTFKPLLPGTIIHT